MSSDGLEPAALAGAAWWTGKLQATVLPRLGRQGALDPVIAESVRLINQAAGSLTSEQVEQFRLALARRLNDRVGAPHGIGTGYQPDAIVLYTGHNEFL